MKKVLSIVGGISAMALVLVGNAFAAADTVLSGQTDQVKQYFSDNIPTVIGLFIGIACLLWMLALAFRSVGAKKPGKVG